VLFHQRIDHDDGAIVQMVLGVFRRGCHLPFTD
jgi:hypothetical protein